MELIVTLDQFFQDWDTSGGRLWLCVQPHVVLVGPSPVTDWVRQSHDGSQASYRIAALSATRDHAAQFVPVPFTDDCQVEVELLDALGAVVQTFHPIHGTPRDRIINDLSAAFQVVDPGQFFAANRTQAAPQPPGGIQPQPVYAEPFARGYNHTLRDAANGFLQVPPPPGSPPARPLDETGLQQMLRLGFWGGVRRLMPRAAVTQTDSADWMQVGVAAAGEPEVNLHSLCGLLFCLGSADDLQRLSEVRDIRIRVVHADWSRSIQDMDSVESRASIAAFFGGLKTFPPGGPGLRPALTWQPDFADRVYAMDDGSAFIHAQAGAAHWFLRPPGRHEPRTGTLRRLLVSLFENRDGVARPSRLHLVPWVSFGVSLSPYRSYPLEEKPGVPPPPGLLELTAHPEDAARLDAFLAAHPDALGTAQLHEASGEPYAGALELIGRYEFPWDVARRGGRSTLLYWGHVPAQSLILRMPLVDGSGHAHRFVAERVLPDGKPNPFGDRWEAGVVPIQDDFDALLCAAVDGPDTLLASMVATVVWPGEVAFEFAQSASSVEGNVAVDFENPPEPERPEDITPAGEYKSDLINFNALNVYYGWTNGTGGLAHLNPDSELYPVKETREQHDTHLLQHYVFRERPPAQVPPARQDVAAFYQALFAAVPAGRTLQFDIEHTYGPRLVYPAPAHARAFLDFPPLPASKVAGRAPPTALRLDVPKTPFLTCRLVDDKTTESLVLIFETGWLEPTLRDDPKWGAVHVQAWRSVCELAFAKELSITASCLVFDHVLGAKAEDSNLLAALRPDGPTQALFPVPCTATLQALALQFLAGRRGSPKLPIVLSAGGQPRISTRCHLVEFSLEVKRTDDRIPDAGHAWKLLRMRTDLPVDRLYDDKGQLTNGPSAGDAQAFAAWLQSLASAVASIEPEPSAVLLDRTSLLRKLLSGSAEGAHQWIVPTQQVQGDGRASLMSLCPVGFRPLAEEAQILRGQTARLMARYMEALAAMLDCRSTIWAGAWVGAAPWRIHFDALQRRGGDVLLSVQRAVALLLPLPDPAAAAVDPIVAQSVVAWHDPATDLKSALVAWAERSLLADPGLYASAKALLYTRLWGRDGQPVSGDFFEVHTEKLISDHGEPTALVDRDVFTYRQGLSALAGGSWFGFAEVLDDARYDSSFILRNPALIDFETVIGRILASDVGKPPPTEIPMPLQQVHTPQVGARVPLASRERIADPVAVFSGEIGPMRRDKNVDGLRVADLFDRGEFMVGRLLASSDPSRSVRLVARTPTVTGRRDQYRDDYVLSAIIAIRGDEESGLDWTAGWENDNFYLSMTPAPAQAAGGSAQPFDTKVSAFFERLANTLDPSRMANLEAGYDATVLAYAQHALAPAPVQAFDETKLWSVALNAASGVLSARLHPPGGAAAPHPPMIEAFVFRPVTVPRPGEADLPQAFLVINWLCKVWEPQQLVVHQTRNVGKGFAAEFGSAAVLAVPQYQPFVSEDLYGLSPTTLERRTYALKDFVAHLLGGNIVETLSDTTRFDLSVTVSHDQFVQVVGEYMQEDGKIASTRIMPTRSALPVLQVHHRALQWPGAEIDLGAFPYADAVVHFQWSSPSNLQFFRLHSRRLTIVG